MKNRILSLIVLMAVAYGCGSSKIEESVTYNSKEPVGANKKPSKIYKKPSDIEGIDEIVSQKEAQFTSGVKIGFIMNFLASDELEGRDTGSEGIQKAADFIETIFVKNGVRPYFESYRDTISDYKDPAYNMVGVVEGNDSVLKKQYIVVGAQYDPMGRMEAENGGDMSNGADDIASGATTVLELARYFGNSRSNKRSIIFALFGGEEKGFEGSRPLAQKLKQENKDLYAVLNYKMDGVPLADKDYLMYLTGYGMSNLADVANSYSDETYAGNLPNAEETDLFEQSDDDSFQKTFDIPSQTFSTFGSPDLDQGNEVADETSEMDFEHMANVVNKSIPVIEGIANASSKEIKYN